MSSAVERYLAVCRPHHFRVVRIVIIVIVIITLIIITLIIITIMIVNFPRIYNKPPSKSNTTIYWTDCYALGQIAGCYYIMTVLIVMILARSSTNRDGHSLTSSLASLLVSASTFLGENHHNSQVIMLNIPGENHHDTMVGIIMKINQVYTAPSISENRVSWHLSLDWGGVELSLKN